MYQQARILLISPCPEDHLTFGAAVRPKGWELKHATSWAEARRLLRDLNFTAVVIEANLGDCHWRDVFSRLAELDPAGAPPIIVTSANADDRLWSEVLNLGGHNVLAKPFEQREVSWVLETIPRASVEFAAATA